MNKFLLLFSTICYLSLGNIFSQSCATCSAVTSYTANLTSNPNNTYTVTSNRNGQCCQGSGSDRCVRFEVSVHPSATQIQFLVSTGNNGNWEINCAPPLYTPSSKPCLNGLTNFCITYCNPGGGSDTYTITTSTGLGTGADLNLRAGCTGSLSVRGLSEPSITWTSVFPGAAGAYNSFLSCLSGCDTSVVTPTAGAPTFIDYKVCGSATGCASTNYCDTQRVFVSPALTFTVNPTAPVLCSSGSGSLALTTTVTGGSLPYTYSWAPGGLTTSSISATSPATYTIAVNDNTSGCGAVTKTITVASATTPTVTASPAIQSLCSGQTTSITLTSNSGTTTYSWVSSQSGVTGASSGTTSTITQTLTTTSLSSGTVIYTITPTEAGCAGNPIVVTVTVNPAPTMTVAPSTQSLCSGGITSFSLTSNVAATTYSWTTTQTNATGASASSGTLIAQNLIATTSSSGSVVYTITPTFNSCPGGTKTVSVNINPTPSVTATPGSQSLCSGNATSIALTGGVAGTTYSWTVTQSGITGATASTGTNIPQTLSTTGASIGTAVFTITPTANSCNGTPIVVTVSVNPTPSVIATPSSQSLCSGNATSIALTGGVAGTTYSWTVTQSGITGATASTGTNIAQTLNTTGAIIGTAVYTITPTANSCNGTPVVVTISVNPTPSVTATPSSQSLCSGNSTSIALTGGVAGTTYSWTVTQSGITGAIASTGTNIAQTLNTTGSSIGTAVYTITPTANSCNGTPIVVTVSVNPTPSVTATPISQSLCSGNATSIALTGGVSGTTYSWTVTQSGVTGATASTGINIAQTLSTTGSSIGTAVYTITPTANSCNGTPFVVTVSVNPTPSVTATPSSQSLCSGNSTSIALTGGVAGTTYSWTVTQSGITGATASTGTNIAQILSTTSSSIGTAVYTITPTANSCNGTPFVVTVSVNPTPSVTATPSSQSLCSGNATSIALTGGVSGTTYSWTVTQSGITGATASTGTNIAQTLNTTGASIGTAVYTVTPTANSCNGTPFVVTVSVNPTPSVTATPSSQFLCSGNATSIALTGGVSGTTYSWTVTQSGITGATASTGTNITQTLSTTGASIGTAVYTITPTANSCNGTPIVVTVSVNPTPIITSTNSGVICSAGAITIPLTSNVASAYTWIAADNSNTTGESTSIQSTNSINNTITNNTTSAQIVVYTVTPTSTSGSCVGAAQIVSVTVNPTPVMTNTDAAVVCSGSSFSIALTSNVASTYTWIAANNANTTGESITTQTATTLSNVITNTTTSAQVVTYTVTPTTSAGSCAGVSQVINVNVNPKPVMTSTNSAAICSGNSFSIALTSNVASTYTWVAANNANTTGESTTTQSSATLSDAITNNVSTSQIVVYTVTPTSSAGSCLGTPQTVNVTVNPAPTVTATPSSQALCSANTTSIALTGGVAGTTYSWTVTQTGISGASASSGTNIAQTLSTTGTSLGTAVYTITPSANGCNGTPVVVTVSVSPTPSVTATPGSQSLCSGNASSIALTSNVAGTTFSWTVTETNVTGASASTGTLIAQTLSTTTTSSGTALYTITPSSNGCGGTTTVVTVAVNPTPIMTSTNAGVICSGGTITIPLTSNVASAYTWIAADNGNTTGESTTTQSTNSINNTITNTTTSAQIVIYTVTPTTTAGSCVGAPQTVSVTVNPTPVMTNTSAAVACSASSFSIALTSNVASTYTWIAANNANTTGESITTQTATTLSNVITNTTTSAQVVTYTVTPTTSAGSCAGVSQTVSVTVNPIPVMTSTNSTSICSGNSFSVALTSNIPATYSWIASDNTNTTGESTTSQSSSTISDAITNNVITSQIVTYTVTPNSSTGGCLGSPQAVSVTINVVPTLTSVTSATICSGGNVILPLSSNVLSTYTWVASNNLNTIGESITTQTTAAINNTIISSSGNTETILYTATPTSGIGSCIGATNTLTLTINPTPTLTITPAAQTICSGNTATISLSSDVAGTTYSWTSNQLNASGASSGNGSVITQSLNATGIGSGTVNYTITPGIGTCSGLSSVAAITINPTPTVVATPSSQILCSGNTTTITLSSTTAGTTYSWTANQTNVSGATAGSGTLIAQSLTATGSTQGTAVYTVTPSANGCSGIPIIVTVSVNPIPSLTIAPTSQGLCTGSTTSLTLSSNVISTSYSWTASQTNAAGATAGSGTLIAQTITATSASVGTIIYTITPAAAGCAGTPIVTTVSVSPLPVIATLTNNGPICVNGTLNLTASFIAGVTYNWSGPNSFTSAVQNPTITNIPLIGSGVYSVTANLGGCIGPVKTTTVVVNPPPPATLTVSSNSPLCSTNTLSLSVAPVTAATYSWSGPNSFSSALQNPTVTNASTLATGTYSVFVTVSGCGSSGTETVSVIVNQTPSAPATTNNGPLCVGATLSLTASGSATTYSWTGVGGFVNANQNPTLASVSLTNSGIYSVTATSNGCTSNTGTTTVVVNPIPSTPTISTNAPVCVGQNVSLTTNSVSGATYNWSGPNSYTSSVQSPVITNASTVQAGTYSLSLIVNGCSSLINTLDIAVNTAPTTPTATSSPACLNDTLFLFANSAFGSTYSWTGPNGFTSSLQNPFIPNATLAANGTYTVIANNGCSSVPATISVSVTPKPSAPVISSNSPLCEGGSLNLSASNTGTTYLWSGPSSFTASVQNPTITPVSLSNAGVYSVVAAANGCISATRTVAIVINPIPSAPAIGNNSPVCTGQSFNLTVTPVFGATYIWSGPATYTSSVQSPTITNAITVQAGTYSLTVIVAGCSSATAAVTSVTIINTPLTPSLTNNGPLCVGNDLNLTASGSETTYGWTGPGGFTSAIQNPTITAVALAQGGTYSVSATTNGCTSSIGTTTVIINSIPTTPTVSSNAPVCVGQTFSLTTNSITGATYNWSGPNSYTSSVQSPSITNASTVQAGTYSLSLIVNGCASSTGTVDVAINNAAPSPTLSSNSPLCSGDTLFLSALSVGGATYSWFGPNGFTSTIQNPFIANTTTLASGTYTVIANNGCASTPAVITVTVNQKPNTPTITSNSPLCLGNNLNLSATFIAGGSFSWSGPNGFTSSTQTTTIPNITTAEQGTYSVTVTKNGCTSSVAINSVTVNIPSIAGAGFNQTVCANNGTVALTGTVSGGSSTGLWTSSGSGTFNPIASSLTTNYIPSSADTSAGSFVLTISSTNNGACPVSASSVSITITDAPVAIAGSSFAVCANNANINLNGIVYGGSSTGVWTASGSGIFNPNATTLITTYIPSSADTAAGLVTFTLASTSNGQCFATSSQVSIVITDAPIVNAGVDQITCKANPNALLSGTVSPSNSGVWTTLGTGTFNPNATTLNSTYIPSSADTAAGSVKLVLTSANNGGCAAISDTVKISFSDIPTVNAGTTQTVCANNSLVTLIGTITGGGSTGIWTSSGTGSFNPNATTLNASYIASAADTASGVVILTLSSTSGCVVVTDNIAITITPAPFVFAGANISVCSNNSTANYNGSVSGVTSSGIWSTNGSGTFSPDNVTLSGNYTPSATDITSGSVYLILTSTNNGNCNATIDSLKLTITPPPVALAGNDTAICANNNLVLNGVITGGAGTGIWTTSGTGSFTPSSNTLTATYVPSAADTTAHQVLLTLTSTNNGGCLAATDNLTLTINPGPSINAGSDQTICSTSNTVSLTGQVTIASGLQWSTLGDGTFSSASSATTTYSIGAGDITNGQVKIVASSTGNGDCSAAKDTMIINIQQVPFVNAGANQFVCQGIMTVNLNGTITGSSNSGIWSTLGSGTFNSTTALNATYTLSTADTTAGSVKLVLSSTNNGLCNQVSDTLLVTITPAGIASAGNDTTVCSTSSIINLSGVIFGGTGAGQWTSNGTGSFAPSSASLTATYSLSAADIAAGNITIKLTPINSCLPKADSLVITINPKPIVNAGTDQTICSSTSTVSLNGNISGGTTSGIWTTLGSGSFFPNATTLNSIYTVSTADSLAGSVELVLTSTNNGICSAATDTVKIFISNSTSALVGNDTTICSSDSLALNGIIVGGSQAQWTSNGTGVFNPSNTTLNATYVPSAIDITSGIVVIKLTPTSGCQLTADSLVLTINPKPIVDAGTDQTICSTTSTVTLNGNIFGGAAAGIWTTLGSGSFSPNATTLNSIYTVSTADSLAGSVELVLTSTNNGICSAATDTVKIFISNSTSALVGNDTTICSSDSLALIGIIIGGSQAQWTSNGTGVFNPNNTSLNATYVPSAVDVANGSVVIKLTPTSGCQLLADSLIITINPKPIVNAGSNISICASTNTIQLNGNVTNGSTTGIWTTAGSGIFLPNDSTLNGIYQLSTADSTAGIVTLYLTATHNTGCGVTTDSIKVNVTTPAFAFVGNDAIVCANNISSVLSGTINGGTGEGQWTSNGSGLFTPNDTTMNPSYIPSAADIASGNVIITLTPINACAPAADSLVLTITPSPTVSAGADLVLCGSLVPINLVGSINTVPTGAVWTTNGSGTFNPNDSTLNGTYIPAISDEDTLRLVLTTTGNGFCNAVTDTMFVIRNVTPITDFVYSNLCSGQTISFTDSSKVSVGTIVSWSWDFGNGNTSAVQNPTDSYSVSGTYSVSLIINTSSGCTDSITKVLLVNPTPVSSFSFVTACSNDSVRFINGSSINPGVINSWDWNFGDGNSSTAQNPAHLFDSTKVYTVSLTALSDAGCSASFSQTITINPAPIAGFKFQSNCGLLSVNFNDTSLVDGGTINSWNWNFGDNNTSIIQNPTHTYSTTGTYTVILEVSTSNGCKDTVSSVVNLSQSVLAAFIPTGGNYNVNEMISFTNQSTGASNYQWTFADGSAIETIANPQHAFSSPGTYSVTLIVANEAGCIDTVSYLFDINTSGYTIPTAFTPNGDGLNDGFSVLGGPFVEYELRVFNEWGNQIFISNSQGEKWDGTYKGIIQPAGTYIYVFNGKILLGDNLNLKGEVNIIK
ncbi:MAG: PKD domain-containing protein [Bacteroidia bacterium]|nr:PKD domain-containing protein [Bacteroidia bacterium]